MPFMTSLMCCRVLPLSRNTVTYSHKLLRLYHGATFLKCAERMHEPNFVGPSLSVTEPIETAPRTIMI